MRLIVENLSFSYQNKKILNNISFTLEKTGITAILGSNGSGKTTLLRCINNILKPQSGKVFINEKQSSLMKNKDRAKLLSYTAQNTVASNITVFDSILMGRVPYVKTNVSENDIKETTRVIKEVGLEKLSLRRLCHLSGGELQKTAIARALVQDVPIMLLDEPTAALDLKNQVELLQLLKKNTEKNSRKVLISIHDLNTALRYADSIIFLKNGSIVDIVEAKEINTEIIEKVYDVPVQIYKHPETPYIVPILIDREE